MKLILVLALTAAAFCAHAGSVTKNTKQPTRTVAEADRRIKTTATQVVTNLHSTAGEKVVTECPGNSICYVTLINPADNQVVAIYKVDIDEDKDGSFTKIRIMRKEQKD